MEQQVFNDRYKIIAKIGTGGMAEVYKAIDAVLDRPVAIKVLHRHFAEDPDFVSRFRREAQAAASLNHPNIVSIYDWGSENGTYFIVMELLEGQTLRDYLRAKGKIAPLEAMDITRKVLSALNFAHKHDIVHRDIKPHNIILANDGEVKVTDFGIARAGASQMTQTGTILGTAHYLSPEQARGQDVGVTSDIYSMGVVLYEMVTGKVPFDGENTVAIALKHVHEVPVRASELNPDIPEDLQTIISKAMAKSPENRYHGAIEMRSDVMRAMEGMPIVAVAPEDQETVIMAPPTQTMRIDRERPVQRQPVKKKTRGPLIVVAAVLILILAGAGVYAGVINAKKSVTIPDVQKQPFDKAVQILKDKGLKPVKKSTEFSNTLDDNYVLSQDPAPGEKKDEGSTVYLIVSRGQEKITVPDVNGDTPVTATRKLLKAGLEVRDSKYENNDEVDEGMVTRTDPASGGEVAKGSVITLYISKGPATNQIPDEVGKTQAEAIAELKQSGFQVIVSQEFSEDTDKGKVTRTTPAGGNDAKKGAAVTIYVSKGPEMVSVPDVRGKLEDEARDILENAGFTVSVQDVPGVSQDQDSKVISQDPTSGSQVKKRDPKNVTIYVGQAH